MKTTLLIIAYLLSINAMAQKKAIKPLMIDSTGIGIYGVTDRSGYIAIEFSKPAGHHLPMTQTTIILNKGKSDCQHDWVSPKPMYTSNMVTAVWRDPDTDQSWQLFRVCKNCLRHEQINYFSKWVLNKDEYGELIKKIKP